MRDKQKLNLFVYKAHKQKKTPIRASDKLLPKVIKDVETQAEIDALIEGEIC